MRRPTTGPTKPAPARGQGLSSKQKGLLHVAKSALGMSDDEYRDLLEAVAGVRSSTRLDQRGFDRVMDRLRALGFEPLHKISPEAIAARNRLRAKVAAQLDAQGLPWSYADAIARRMHGVDRVVWCNAEQLVPVVAALNYHDKRTQRRESS